MDTEVVTRLRGVAANNPYSNRDGTDLAWTSPAAKTMTTLAPAEPLFSEIPLEDGRRQVQIGWRLYLDETEDVTAQDRMKVRDEICRISGEIETWTGGGLVVTCERVEG